MHKLINIVLSMVVAVFEAFVFSVLWGYFVSPKFGLPPLTLLESWGVLLLISLPHTKQFILGMKIGELNSVPDIHSTIKYLSLVLVVYPVALLIGYVIHSNL